MPIRTKKLVALLEAYVHGDGPQDLSDMQIKIALELLKISETDKKRRADKAPDKKSKRKKEGGHHEEVLKLLE